MLRKSKDDMIFDTINYTLLGLCMFIVLYPLYYTIISSVSDGIQVINGNITVYPKGFTLDAYLNVYKNMIIWIGYRNTIFYTIAGTLINLCVTIPCAYGLSKKKLAGKNIIMFIFVFTMYFHGGIIPSYLLVRSLGFPNTPWVMIIPGAISVYNMIVTRTFYQSSIPEELYEAARIDGSSEFNNFFRIALPLSAPIIAVMALFYGVGHWNSFFTALIYINKEKLYPLQLVLRNILIMNQNLNIDVTDMEELEMFAKMAYRAETMKYALIFVASFPVLCAYPFIQRYFVKGVMIGSLKE